MRFVFAYAPKSLGNSASVAFELLKRFLSSADTHPACKNPSEVVLIVGTRHLTTVFRGIGFALAISLRLESVASPINVY